MPKAGGQASDRTESDMSERGKNGKVNISLA
jgi:hypothetical protein